MRTLLLVDFMNLFHISANAHEGLSFRGKETGAFYGFVTGLCYAINRHRADSVIVCTDAPPLLRTKTCLQYKTNRKHRKEWTKEKIEAIDRNKKDCEEFLHAAGIPLWVEKGYEADDLIAWGVRLYKNDFDRIVIRSNDSDLFQLFRYRKHTQILFDRKGRKEEPYTYAQFKEDYEQISPKDWPWVQALSGGHNYLPRIKKEGAKTNIGERGALKIVKNKKELAELRRKNKQVDINYTLAYLPFDPSHRVFPPPLGIFNDALVGSLLSKRGINYTQTIDDAISKLD